MATPVQIDFKTFSPEHIPERVSVIEAETSHWQHDSTKFLKKSIPPVNPGYPTSQYIPPIAPCASPNSPNIPWPGL
jgi:hypothetical protein